MEARELFEVITAEWPAVVDISVRRTVRPGQHWFPALAGEHERIEGTIDFPVEVWKGLAAWCFYQSITSYSCEIYEAGARTVSPTSVPIAEFDRRVRKNLLAEGYEQELAGYVSL